MRNRAPLFFLALALWVLFAPATFGYAESAIGVSDVITGIFLLFLGVKAKQTKKNIYYVWIILLGLWMQLAPLFLWAKEPSAYANGTFVGMLLILLAFQVIGDQETEGEKEIPPGWSFNPSEYKPRIITAGFAMFSWFLARYLAAYQLGYIDSIWDPFTGEQTVKVITSSVAKSFPVSDAGLGAFGYSLDFLLAVIGSSRRWRTMPWLSLFFGVMVVPAGCISVLLIILQPILVKAWCGLCLLIAVSMLFMIVLTLPEVVAVCKLLYAVKQKKGNLLQVFFYGISRKEVELLFDKKSEPLSFMGVTFPWNLVLTLCSGVALMVFSSVITSDQLLADIGYVIGPLLVAISAVSMAEIARVVRKINILLGLFLVISSFWFFHVDAFGAVVHIAIGVFAILFSLRKGKILGSYGS